MRKFAIAAAFGAALVGAVALVAKAQDAPAPAPVDAEALRAALKEKALTRARTDAPVLGVPAGESLDAKIDWVGMQREMALTQRREVAAQQGTSDGPRRPPPGVRAAPAEQFKNVVQREINVTNLPVLAPEGERIRQTLKVYSLGDSYSATAEVEDGVSMRMSGSRKKIVIGDQASARKRIGMMRAEQKTLPSLETIYLITRSDTSTDLSFAKFGAGYVLSLMCDDPEDARCKEDAFIVSLASSLMLLNPDAGDR